MNHTIYIYDRNKQKIDLCLDAKCKYIKLKKNKMFKNQELYNHYLIWKEAVENNHSISIIYSDLQLLTNEIYNYINYIEKYNDLIFYMHIDNKYHGNIVDEYNNRKIIQVFNIPNTYSYYASKDTCKKLIDLAEKNKKKSLDDIFFIFLHNDNIYTYNPPLLYDNKIQIKIINNYLNIIYTILIFIILILIICLIMVWIIYNKFYIKKPTNDIKLFNNYIENIIPYGYAL